MEFEEYKFKFVYEFADIIYNMVVNGIEFYNYDAQQFIDASTRFNKVSLLHIYTYTQLNNYYYRLYSKNSDCVEENEYLKWKEISKSYGKKLITEYDPEYDFIVWYEKNQDVIEDIFEDITNEVVFILFSNTPFLLKFNRLVASLIEDSDGQRDWDFPKETMENGKIKRCKIPQWVKLAVFHRDHGKCVFCGKDLTGVYSNSNQVNYDHIIPLNKFGVNDPCNIQTTCENCNKSKKDNEENPNYKFEPWW